MAAPDSKRPSPPPAGSGIERALQDYAASNRPPRPASSAEGGIAGAVALYADADAGASAAPPQDRPYRVGEVGWLLGVCALALLALDGEGLVTWARRMEVGPAQSAWLSVLTPLRDAGGALGLGLPREQMLSAADRLSSALGSGEDPLFVQAWRAPQAALPAGPVQPVELAQEEELPVEQEDPPAASEPKPPPDPEAQARAGPAVAKGKPITMLLVGDSLLAGSLGAAITRAFENNPKVRVVQAVQSATGLSRPDVFDWMQVVPPLVEREKPQLVVCSFGANDAQGIRQGDRLLEFGDPAWRSAYRERVLTMMRSLAGENTRLLWLGLPPMRDRHFSEKTRQLNQLFSASSRRVARVEYLQLDMLLSGPRGDFATFVPDSEGRFSRLRMEDGVHYSPAGARAIARWVVDWAYERLPSSRP